MSASSPPSIARRSVADQAADALRAQIADGTWSVGARIPTEPELVAALGIGRNAVREAVRALVHAGLLETRQGDGTYVRATSELAGAVRRRANRAALIELFEVRRALEVEAGALAAQRRTAADVAKLERALRRRAERWANGDVEGFVEADVAFHQGVAAAARNSVLLELYDTLGAAVRDAVRTTVTDAALADVDHAAMHDGLLEAIRAKDPEAARKETARYLDRYSAALKRGAR